jgi:hypothetical protein
MPPELARYRPQVRRKAPSQALGTPKAKNVLSVVASDAASIFARFLGVFQIPKPTKDRNFTKKLQ